MLLRSRARIVGGVVLFVLIPACGDDSGGADGTTTLPTGSSTTESTATEQLPDMVTMDAAGAEQIDAPGFADWVVVTDGVAWVANVGGGVRRYDAASGAELGTTKVEGFVCESMDVGFGALWLAACGTNTVVRIELETGNVVATIVPGFEVAEEASIAAGDDAVYVMSAGAEPTVARIDPSTNTVAGTFAAPPGSAAVRAGLGALWFSQPAGTITKVDPDDGSVLATADAGLGARFLTVSEDAVWVLASVDATVTRVDGDANVVATIQVGTTAVTGGDISAGGDSVWARISDAVAAQIDVETNTVVARFGYPAGSGGIAADESSAWISAHDKTLVWRLPLG